MRLMKQSAVLAVFLFAAVCVHGQEVHYNYDRGANFTAFKTYQWVDIPGGAVPDQLIDQAIRRAVDEQLAQKGLTKVEKDGELLVGYQTRVFLEKSVNLTGTGGNNVWGPWNPMGTTSVHGQTATIPVGVLLVDIYDPAKNQLIWRGDATATIDIKKDPDKNYKNLRKAMTKLFKNYPPKPKG